MTSNVDIMYDAISEVLSDCDRAEADLQERIGSLKAINADLLETLEGLCAVVGKMKPASGEPYGRAVAELIEARTVIAKARGQS